MSLANLFTFEHLFIINFNLTLNNSNVITGAGGFDNKQFHNQFDQNDIIFRFSYPRTSQQNGKSERMI